MKCFVVLNKKVEFIFLSSLADIFVFKLNLTSFFDILFFI